MATINLHGQPPVNPPSGGIVPPPPPPGAPPGRGRGGRTGATVLPDQLSFIPGLKPFPTTGPRSEIPFMRSGLNEAFASNQPTVSVQTTDDYDRAIRQKAAQVREDASAEGSRRQEQNRAFKQKEQTEGNIQRQLQRQSREEIQLNDRRLQLELRRYRFQQSLGVNLSALQQRAGRAFTPSTYRAVMARSNTLRTQLDQFNDQFGLAAAPFRQGAITDLQTGMGSYENTFRTQNVARLGNLGGRAANEGSFTELVRIEHELNRIYKQAEATAKNTGNTAKQKIDAQRIIDAVGAARQQIAAGRSGNSGLMNMGGNAMGGLGLLLKNPWVDLAVGGSLAALTAPLTVAALRSMVAGMARPYADFRQGLAAIGRGGNFNSQTLESKIYTGAKAPDWMQTYGLRPGDATSILEGIGIAPFDSDSAVGNIQGILRAQFSPYNTLSRGELEGYQRQLGNLGVVSNAPFLGRDTSPTTEAGPAGGLTQVSNADQFFRKLGEVQAAATSLGIDHSAVMRTQLQLMQSTAASGGAAVPSQGLADWLMKQMGGGTPGLRTGATEMSAIQGFNSTVSNLGVGGNQTATVALQTYFARNGGAPKNQEDLRKFLDMDKDTFGQMMSQPANAEAWKQYLASPDGSLFKYNYLGQFITGHPELASKIYKGSIYGTNPDYTQAVGQSNVFNTPLQSTLADQASGGRTMAYFSNLIGEESGGHQFNPKTGQVTTSPKGALGIGQLMPQTAEETAKKHGIPFDLNRVKTDTDYNLTLSRLYLQDMAQRYNDNPAAAIAAYNTGPGNVDSAIAQAQKRGGSFLDYVPKQETRDYVKNIMGGGQLSGVNFPYEANKMNADVGAAQMKGAQYVFDNLEKTLQPLDNVVGTIVNKFSDGVGALTGFIQSVLNAKGVLDQFSGSAPAAASPRSSSNTPSSSYTGYGTTAPARP